jgi:hypothetical protein
MPAFRLLSHSGDGDTRFAGDGSQLFPLTGHEVWVDLRHLEKTNNVFDGRHYKATCGESENPRRRCPIFPDLANNTWSQATSAVNATVPSGT